MENALLDERTLRATELVLEDITKDVAYLLPVSVEVVISLKMSRETGSVYATYHIIPSANNSYAVTE